MTDALEQSRVYIAGPMRGIARWNFPAFDAARDYLKDRGFDVVSPADLDRKKHGDAIEFQTELPPGFVRDALARDMAALATCDAIYMLDGWQDSKGARAELAFAQAVGFTVMSDTPWTITDEPQPTTQPTDTILDEAKRLTRGDRNKDYGHPIDDYDRTAAIWSIVLGTKVTAEQAILCMIGVKMSRLCHDITKHDSHVDVAGYADCLARVVEERKRRTAA